MEGYVGGEEGCVEWRRRGMWRVRGRVYRGGKERYVGDM